jgi:hypothetical protein
VSQSEYVPVDLIKGLGDPSKWVHAEAVSHTDWDRMRPEYPNVEPRADLRWVAIDLDGTLADSLWTPDNPTSHIGYPIWENVRKAREVEAAGYKIVIHTSRGWTDYENIEGWCNHYNVPYRRIVCGKLLAVLYIDDRGRHADAESWLPQIKE